MDYSHCSGVMDTYMIFGHVDSITPYSSACALLKSDWWL